MKKLLPIFIFVFAFTIQAQTKKPVPKPVLGPDPAKISNEIKLESLRKQKQEKETYLAELRTKYSDDYPAIQKIKLEIDNLDSQIKTLLLNSTPRKLTVEDLPNDSTFLLKLIIIQNQRIIELLEKKP